MAHTVNPAKYLTLVLALALPLTAQAQARGSGNSSPQVVLFWVALTLIVVGVLKLRDRFLSPAAAEAVRPWLIGLLVIAALYTLAQLVAVLKLVHLLAT